MGKHVSFLVVGSGVAGLLSAAILSATGASVTVLERGAVLGGLLATRRFGPESLPFDYGTHIPTRLGIAELDAILYGNLKLEEWNQFPVLKSGNYAFGSLNSQSSLVNLHGLGVPLHDKIEAELLSFPQPVPTGPPVEASLEHFLHKHYGRAVADAVYAPIMRKFFGHSLANLAPHAHKLFGLVRFICGNAEKTAELKQIPAIDSRLGYHSFTLGASGNPGLYPRQGGIGVWVDALADQLTRQGVQFMCGENIVGLSGCGENPDKLVTARVQSGKTLAFDHLVWTLPAGLLLRLAGHPAAAHMIPPRFARIVLYHFVLDRPLSSDLLYITCMDPALRTFRITLYDNLQGGTVGQHRVTVEVLIPDPHEPAPEAKAILQELVTMGLLPSENEVSGNHAYPGSSHLLAQFQEEISTGFPILTSDFAVQSQQTLAIAETAFVNVSVFGRGSGGVFFMNDVMLDIFRKLPVIAKAYGFESAGSGSL